MPSINPNDSELAWRAFVPTPSLNSSPATRTEAGLAQGSNPPPGFSQKDTFTPAGNGQDPVEGTINQQNSQAEGRAGLVDGQFAKMDGIQGKSNRAWSWHQLIMEMIRLQRPS